VSDEYCPAPGANSSLGGEHPSRPGAIVRTWAGAAPPAGARLRALHDP
jgi:hypothetical protein